MTATTAAPVTGFIVQLRPEPGAGAVEGGSAGLLRAQSVLIDKALPLSVKRALSGPGQRVLLSAPPAAASARSIEAQLRADRRVLSVVPDVREQRQEVTPADPRYSAQWWLQAVAAGNTGAAGFAKAWQRSTGVANRANPGAVVAVLDSGITSHIETNARLLPGYDFVADSVYAADGNGRDNDPADPGDAITAADRLAQPDRFGGCPDALRSSWHGSTIAGQLAAVSNNTEGGAAANWQGLVVPVRVAGKCGAAVSDIIDGLRWAAGLAVAGVPANLNPARLIVLSYGGVYACDRNSATPAIADTARLYESALAEVRAAGALVFVAAGNQRAGVGRPASCAGAFAVASVNREGFKASYANFGPQIALTTPGGDSASGGQCESGAADLRDSGIVATGNLGDTHPGAAGYVAASRTSFAAPGRRLTRHRRWSSLMRVAAVTAVVGGPPAPALCCCWRWRCCCWRGVRRGVESGGRPLPCTSAAPTAAPRHGPNQRKSARFGSSSGLVWPGASAKCCSSSASMALRAWFSPSSNRPSRNAGCMAAISACHCAAGTRRSSPRSATISMAWSANSR